MQCLINKVFGAKFVVASLCVLHLAGCGGGGGGSSSGAANTNPTVLSASTQTSSSNTTTTPVASPSTFTVNGTVAGLTTGSTLVLSDNGTDSVSIKSDGAFTFATPVAVDGSYLVTVATQPAGQICTVTNASGSGIVANISNVTVMCSTDSFTVSGNVTGLTANHQVTLVNNGSDAITLTANGAFEFSVPVAYGSGYAVTVGTEPDGQVCSVSGGTGTDVAADISNVTVNCVTSSNLVFSPYMYYGDYNDNTHRLLTSLTVTYPATQTMLSVMPDKLTTGTWAFATGTCGSETWSGTPAADFASANVASFVAAGKKYIVSTGGAGNNFLCASSADFIKFIQTYYSANMVGVDFDIENTQTQADVNNLVQVIVAAQAAYPNLRFSFTVGSNGGNVPTLDYFGTYVLNAISTYGLKNYTINLMVMDYTASGHENAAVCTLAAGSNLCEMGLSAIAAAKNLHNHWGVPYNQIELTPMAGGNDDYDEVFTIADAGTLSGFALANNLAGLHFWGFSRDKDCAAPTRDNTATDTCNNYGKAGTLGFTNAFLTGLAY